MEKWDEYKDYRKWGEFMIGAVIFDMDGVIINSEPIHHQCLTIITKEFGFSLDGDQYDQYIGVSAKDMWEDLKRIYSIPESVDTLVDREYAEYVQYLQSNQGEIKPIQGVKELIMQIYEKNIPLVLASSSSRENIELILKMFEMTSYFSKIVSGFEMPKSKPFPDIFLKAANLIGADPKACLVIEDSFSGVTAGKEAGMKVIGFQNIDSGNQDLSKADLVVHEIPKITLPMIKEIFEKGN